MADVTRWIPPRFNPDAVQLLVEQAGVHPLVARILTHRGYTDPKAATRFLHPSLDDLNDPFLLRGMKDAAARVEQAIARQEKILIYGDYDVDGICSTVILKKVIDLAGGRAGFYVPNRLRDGYGMRTDVVEKAAAAGVGLIISVDTGIRAQEAVERAQQAGVDVIVTDHHLPEAGLPAAFAIVNPNQHGCPYPEKSLCGAGVTLKLAHALMLRIGWPQKRIHRLLSSFLKLAAIATVADVVPLTGENRIIVKHGLEGLRDVRNPGLRALMEVAGFSDGDVPTAGQVAFRLAPRLNAAGRMASAADVIEMFLTGDEARASTIAGQLHLLNQERQQTEGEIIRQILEECERAPVSEHEMALVFCGRGWHRGVVGIVANRLTETFRRPVFVLSDEGNGEVQGSGRSLPSFHLLEALESMSDLFVRFGGHRQAAGVTLKRDRVAEFKRRIQEYAAARLRPEHLAAALEIDAEFQLAELSPEAISGILALAPFGFGNPPPLLAARGVTLSEAPTAFKEKHLRLKFIQKSKTLTAKAWNFMDRAAELERGANFDILVSFEPDPASLRRGFPGWSAVLRDVRPAG